MYSVQSLSLPLRSSGLFPLVGLVLMLTFSGCAPSTSKRLALAPPPTVEHVDLQRYSGTWYEIARFPNRFQKGCVATTATYTPRDNGSVEVFNRCHKDTPEGKERKAKGTARPVEGTQNAQLKVSFFWPFKGDYWVLFLDDDYTVACVGSPSRDYLWILSRSPNLPDAEFDELVEQMEELGYPTERLIRPPQITD